nr:alpha/beta hydrolase [Rhodoblastus acidophilus]
MANFSGPWRVCLTFGACKRGLVASWSHARSTYAPSAHHGASACKRGGVSGAKTALARLGERARSKREAEFARLFNVLASERGIVVHKGATYGPDARHRLDVYQADPRRSRNARVLFVYGGGWRDGAREIYRFVGTALAAQGLTTIIPDYRLYPSARFPDFMEDAARAYGWAHAHRLADGPKPVVLMGHSAGAHIAALLALDPTYRMQFAPDAPPPAGLVGLAGPYAFDPTTWSSTRDIFAPAAGHPDRARPVAHARADAPPSLLLYGRADDTVGRFNGQDFAGALSKAGAAARLIEYGGVGHVGLVVAIGRGVRWRAPVLRDVLDFIDGLARDACERTASPSEETPGMESSSTSF